MSKLAANRLERCCPTHRDWDSLASHLVTDFGDVRSAIVVAELRQAQHAANFFCLNLADALDCAELIVRHRVLVATGERPS
jgi:hypothetical protein